MSALAILAAWLLAGLIAAPIVGRWLAHTNNTEG